MKIVLLTCFAVSGCSIGILPPKAGIPNLNLVQYQNKKILMCESQGMEMAWQAWTAGVQEDSLDIIYKSIKEECLIRERLVI